MHSNQRKLSAIVFADIAGYTALMQGDESLGLSILATFEKITKSESSLHNGQLANFYGDGCLLVFDNVNDALACSLKMQRQFLHSSPQIPVRIGIHAGEVIYREGNVFGDSVNLASRIESAAVPGAILISKAVRQLVKNNKDYQLLSLGFIDFKNVEEPMEIFALANEELHIPKKKELKDKIKPALQNSNKTRKALFYAVPIVLLVLVLWRYGSSKLSAGSAAPEPVRSSLAILPFTNLSGNSELDYISDGLAENLISAISKQSELRLMSRHSTFSLRDSMHNLSYIKKLLDVDAFLVGSVDQADKELIFKTELISANSNELISSNKVMGTEQQLVEIERNIASAILVSLNQKEKPENIGPNKSIAPAAYQHYMQGRFLSMGHTQKEIDQSVEHFHKAIELEPQFGLAYAALANQKFAQARFSNTTRQEIIREAKIAIRSALNIDPKLPEALLAQANSKFYYDFDWEGAEQSFRKALAADPDNASINSDFAFFKCAMNDYEEALVLAEKAINLDPVSISSLHIIAWANLYKNPGRSIEEFNKLIELHPNWIWGYLKKAVAEVLIEDCEAALRSLEEVEGRKGDWGGELVESYLALLYKKCGAEARSKEKLQFVFDYAEQEGISDPLNIAILYGGTGNLYKMMEYAKLCIDQQSANVALMQLVKDLDIFFNRPFADSRYQALLKELQFPNN